MFRATKHYCCPYCGEIVIQWSNPTGPNFCTNCRRLFEVQKNIPLPVPPWALGVLAVLAINLHLSL